MVSNVHYGIFVNNTNPADIAAHVPSLTQLGQQLAAQSDVPTPCGCQASKVHTLYLLGDASQLNIDAVQEAIAAAWAISNIGEALFSVSYILCSNSLPPMLCLLSCCHIVILSCFLPDLNRVCFLQLILM